MRVLIGLNLHRRRLTSSRFRDCDFHASKCVRWRRRFTDTHTHGASTTFRNVGGGSPCQVAPKPYCKLKTADFCSTGIPYYCGTTTSFTSYKINNSRFEGAENSDKPMYNPMFCVVLKPVTPCYLYCSVGPTMRRRRSMPILTIVSANGLTKEIVSSAFFVWHTQSRTASSDCVSDSVAAPVASSSTRLTSSLIQRTHCCGELRHHHVGQQVTLCGWVQKTRLDLFLLLRDWQGVAQVLLPPQVGVFYMHSSVMWAVLSLDDVHDLLRNSLVLLQDCTTT